MNLPEFTVLRTSSPRALAADPEWTADTSQPTDGCGTAPYRISGSCSDGYDPHGNRVHRPSVRCALANLFVLPGAACLIAAARNTEGPGDDASPDVWRRSPRISAEAAQPRSPSRRRTSPYESELIRNELRASFSRISPAREAGLAPVPTPADRNPRRPEYSEPSASATVRCV